MKNVDCDVIEDLLPSYSDRISSVSTNKLVEDHLKKCSNCRKVLEGMAKDVDEPNINNQDKEIDYLRGYRKNRIISVIFAIILTITIIDGIYLFFEVILPFTFYDTEFFANINDINVEYMYKYKSINDKDMLFLYLYSEKYKELDETGRRVVENEGSKDIYLKIVAKHLIKPILRDVKIVSGRDVLVDLNDADRIYIEDKRGNIKEVWNKNMNVQSEEEWKHWYIDNYVPKEVKELYNMDYDTLNGAYYTTGTWRHLYNVN